MYRCGFNQSYERYLILRGYDPSAAKLSILKRALIDSWGEVGFHRFWRVWNPGIGHLLYRLYLVLGGNRNPLVATLIVFSLCGFIHDVLMMIFFRRPFVAFTTAFTAFGILTIASRAHEATLSQERWPRLLNALTNVSLLAVSIFGAVQLQMHIFP
jgi:polyferredoxin